MAEPVADLWRDDTVPWPEFRKQVLERLTRIRETPCMCDDLVHDNELHDLATDDVPGLIMRLDIEMAGHHA